MRPATPGVADQLRLTHGRSGRRFHLGRHDRLLAWVYGKAIPARHCSDNEPTSLSALQRLVGLTLAATE
eukprot:6745893-Heterocapsa_arctica.AAC.1